MQTEFLLLAKLEDLFVMEKQDGPSEKGWAQQETQDGGYRLCATQASVPLMGIERVVGPADGGGGGVSTWSTLPRSSNSSKSFLY